MAEDELNLDSEMRELTKGVIFSIRTVRAFSTREIRPTW